MNELGKTLTMFVGRVRRGDRLLPFALLLGLMWITGARLFKPSEAVQAPSVIRGPYLQLGTPTSVVVRWRTNSTTNSRVRFGSAPAALNSTADDAALTTEHIVALTGLTPNTTYYYSVGTTAGALAGGDADHFFITAPTVGSTQAVRFWVIGDAGWNSPGQAAVRDAYYAFNGARRTDLWLTLGDNAYGNGTDAEFQTGFFDYYTRMLRQSVLWPALGNHDMADSITPPPTQPYYQIFTLPQQGEAGGQPSGTKNYYSYNYANVHLVSLDAQVSSRAPGSQMLTWLQNDLANNHQDWLIVYWHHPPYSKGSHDSDGELNLIEMRANVLPILEAYGADLVLCGHSHAYERSYLLDGHYGFSSTFTNAMKKNGGDGRPDGNGAYTKVTRGPGAHEGTVYVVAGSSGTTSGGSLNHPAMFTSLNQLGSLVLDISGNRLDAKFLRETGTVDDSFTILKNVMPNSPPAVSLQPTDQSVCPGGNASFTAAATGNPAPTVQWQTSADGGANFDNLPGANSDSLTLNGVTSGLNGRRYRAVFTNVAGTATTNAAVLTVQTATSIAAPPVSQTVCAGAPVTFTVTPGGTGPFTFQWRRNNTDLPGATGSQYQIPAAAVNDAGAYDVMVTGACGSLISQAAMLTVNSASGVTQQPLTQTVCPGGDATFTAAASGNPAPTVQWQTSTDGGANYQNVPGAQSSSLTINSVGPAQTGALFRAVFANDCGTATSAPALLIVSSFALAPATQNFQAGGGNGAVSVIVNGACPWTAASNALWLTITSGAIGNGTATVNYVAAPNNGPARTGTLTIAGQTFTATQDADCAAIAPLPATLPVATVGDVYSQTLTATGGAPGYEFALLSGALPPGLSLAANGALSGTPSATGGFSFTIKATDANGCTGARSYSMTINTRPVIQPAAVTRQQGSPATVALIANVGDAEQSAGTLAVNVNGAASAMVNGVTISTLNINAAGAVSAESTASCDATTASFTLTVTDNAGVATSAPLTVNVAANTSPTLSYSNQSLLSGASLTIAPTVGPSDNGAIASVALQSPGTFTGALSVNAAGVVSVGNAAPAGTHTIEIRATDNCGAAVVSQFTLTVVCPAINISPTTLPGGRMGINYQQPLTAAGGALNYSWTIEAGALPTGISLSGGNLTGVPVVAGEFSFTVRATDANGCFGARSYALVIRDDELMFYPLPRPLRLLDTRAGFTGCDAPGAQIPGNTSRTQFARRTCDGITIPANARAVTGNITTVQSGGGFLTLYSSDAQRPLVANSNFASNETINNVFTVGLGNADGAFRIFATSSTDVVVDITGYYAPPSANGLYFHSLPKPIRLLETRAGFSGAFTPGAKLPANADTPQQTRVTYDGVTIPASALAIVGNATTLNGGSGFITLYPGGVARPLAASSNFRTGQVMNAPFTVGLS
ncbi:MAG TPA: putative Ig domain-containing protein, partial [Blastocatellia bacterium]|nr:putative Ig domain-containing protein [Blastocatellia bacterium]